jgi:hypothetical protein
MFIEYPYTEPTFEKIQEKLLKERLERFKSILQHKPPNLPHSLMREFFHGILVAFSCVYDKESTIGQICLDAEKYRLGFCSTCKDSPNYVGFADAPHIMCEECTASVEKDEISIEEQILNDELM